MNPDEVADLAITTVAHDGTPLLVRPITPEDAGPLVQAFARLSPESRFMRFFSPVDHLSDAQVRYFTEVDYVDHFAFVAIVDADDGPVGVGVARYIRSADDPTLAEAAITVIDDYHRRGVGSILLEALLFALTRGIRSFQLLVHAGNAPMIAAMEELGAELADSDDATVVRYVLDLARLRTG